MPVGGLSSRHSRSDRHVDLSRCVDACWMLEGQPAWHHDTPLQQHSLQSTLVAAKDSHKVFAYATINSRSTQVGICNISCPRAIYFMLTACLIHVNAHADTICYNMVQYGYLEQQLAANNGLRLEMNALTVKCYCRTQKRRKDSTV